MKSSNVVFINSIDSKALAARSSKSYHLNPRTRKFLNDTVSPRNFKSPQSTSDTRFYTFYGKSKHAIETCYRKHGYLSGYKPRSYFIIASNVVVF